MDDLFLLRIYTHIHDVLIQQLLIKQHADQLGANRSMSMHTVASEMVVLLLLSFTTTPTSFSSFLFFFFFIISSSLSPSSAKLQLSLLLLCCFIPSRPIPPIQASTKLAIDQVSQTSRPQATGFNEMEQQRES